MGRGARNSQKLRARPPAGSPHHAPALPRDTPPKNRENRENRELYLARECSAAPSPLEPLVSQGPGPGSAIGRLVPPSRICYNHQLLLASVGGDIAIIATDDDVSADGESVSL